MAKKKKKSSPTKKFILALVMVILIGGLYSVWQFYQVAYSNNVHLDKGEEPYIYIKTSSTFEDVTNALYEKDIIVDHASFEWMAEKKKYKYNVKPGKYRIKKRMSNNDLINMLRSGNQEPVMIILNQIRTKTDLASQVGKQLEADSTELLTLLNKDSYMKQYDLNSENALALFLPNSYEFYWNTDAKGFMDRMEKEYNRFWTKERKNKAKALGLKPNEISILASIVEKETSKSSEKPIVAGVYINRLKKGMLLQADPTLIYAVGDFTITRVLNVHKQIDSRYNTYKYAGLPPGPICLPDLNTIDAVLNYQKHDYLYFCANSDMSGSHVFAKTYNQHLVNARRFQQELNKRKIYR